VALDHARLPFRHERMEPLTRIERVTYRLRSSRSDRLSYRGLAAGQGFEPRSRGSGPRILPLDDPALVRKAGVEPGVDEFRARQVSRLPSLPRGAPPEARTPFSGLRVRCITRHACGAERHVGVEPVFPIESGQEESNLRSHAPKACALPLGYGQLVDRPGFEPGTFSLRGSCSDQLELAAQGLPGLARRAARAGLAGAHVRP
jgi:hypothetical protein